MNFLMAIITHLVWRDLGFVKASLILQMSRLVNEKLSSKIMCVLSSQKLKDFTPGYV